MINMWRDYVLPNLKGSCYIAGKIKDCIDYKERFQAAKVEVQKLGLVPISPIDLIKSDDYDECMKVDLTVMMRCCAVYALKNWTDSKGATMEVNLARFLHIPIHYQL